MNRAVVAVIVVLLLVVIGTVGAYLYLARTQKGETTTSAPSSFQNPFTSAPETSFGGAATPTTTFANPFVTPTPAVYQNPFGADSGSQQYQNPFEKLR